VEELIHGHLEEIDVEDVATHRVVLDFLNQGKLVGDGTPVGNDEFDEDVLADGMGEKGRDLTLLDLKVAGLVLVSVDNGGNHAAGAEMLDGIAADVGAGTCGKFDLFCHGIRKCGRLILGVLESEQRADRLASMDATDPLTEQLGNRKDPNAIPRSWTDGDAVGGDELLDFGALQPLNR
jgi:hypothetical protein